MPPEDPPARAAPATPKARRTRARILDAALELFAERGYAETTMRDVARRAGVSTGNAYYYFASKDHLVQAFYERSHLEHVAACEDLLARETDLHARLLGVLRTKLDTLEPYHPFSAALFRTAADPQSPLNPFSQESSPTREEAIALMARVLDGSRTRLPADLRAELPELLWLHEMSIILFWVHDRSERQRRSHKLVDHTVDLVVRTIGLLRNPLLAPLRKRTLALLADLRTD